MVNQARLLGIIVMALIIVFGIIHLSVAIGIIAKDNQYSDLFGAQIGLSAFNIVFALLSFPVGGFGLFAVLTDRGKLSQIVAIAAILLGVCALASLIAALVINSKSISSISKNFSDKMNSFAEGQDSFDLINSIQTNYQCCGENLWLDWARISLGALTAGRRRRYSPLLFSMLTRTFRQKRQSGWTTGNLGNLPLSTGIILPASCCINGVTNTGNALGGYCVTNGNNGANTFYLDGCLQPISNLAVSQTMGTGVINCFLVVISFVAIPVLIHLYPDNFRIKRTKAKQSTEQEQQYQEPQYQEPQYQESSYQERGQGQQQQYVEQSYPPPQYRSEENNVYSVNQNAYQPDRRGIYTLSL